MKKKCLVLNDREALPEAALADIAHLVDISWEQDPPERFSLEEAVQRNKDTQVIITTYMDLKGHILEQMPGLEAIITTTISTHFIDSGYCKKKGIKVFNTENYTGTSVAEHAVALMMATIRHIPKVDNEVKQQGNNNCFEYRGIELYGKTAGIIGFGNIGSTIARLLSGFGMKLQYYNRSPKSSNIAQQVELYDLLSSSDIVFLSLPLNHESHEIIREETLARMKKTAVLINVSPDEVMDIDAVKQALSRGDIAAAGLDLLQTGVFKDLSNTVLTPRRAWYTEDCFNRRIGMWKSTLVNFVEGKSQKDIADSDFVPIG
ncbi:MAG: hydroxyacid dehydrogenase [Balneola sp.]|nr:MAG: hydroxyacid dehydrogenase [Balneola sp.]